MRMHKLAKLSRTAIAATSVAALALMFTPGAALAARGGNHAQNAACTAANTTVGSQYTIFGSGYAAGQILNVWAQDSHGTQAFMPAADANGNFAVSSYASWSGAYNVSVYDPSGPKSTLLATCSFQA